VDIPAPGYGPGGNTIRPFTRSAATAGNALGNKLVTRSAATTGYVLGNRLVTRNVAVTRKAPASEYVAGNRPVTRSAAATRKAPALEYVAGNRRPGNRGNRVAFTKDIPNVAEEDEEDTLEEATLQAQLKLLAI
jgi:hypothetical protein